MAVLPHTSVANRSINAKRRHFSALSSLTRCRILRTLESWILEVPPAMKAIFDTRSDTAYDDEIAERYHFPNRYLPEAGKALNDWIVYREPRRSGGRMAYVAVARVTQIAPDPSRENHSYAIVRDFLQFDVPVPLRGPTRYYETRLENLERRAKSVRHCREDRSVQFRIRSSAPSPTPACPNQSQT